MGSLNLITQSSTSVSGRLANMGQRVGWAPPTIVSNGFCVKTIIAQSICIIVTSLSNVAMIMLSLITKTELGASMLYVSKLPTSTISNIMNVKKNKEN
jgi:hypothetical protein